MSENTAPSKVTQSDLAHGSSRVTLPSQAEVKLEIRIPLWSEFNEQEM